jgi:hypothetical protein
MFLIFIGFSSNIVKHLIKDGRLKPGAEETIKKLFKNADQNGNGVLV